MLDRELREVKEKMLTPLVTQVDERVHPNIITLIGLGFGLAAGVAALLRLYPLALLLWGVNRLLDGLDGTVARERAQQSDLGAYLDILIDFVVYAFIPVMLAVGINTREIYLMLALLLSSFYINAASWMYLAALLEKRKHGATSQAEMTSVTMPRGLVEGMETILFFTLFLLLPAQAAFLFGTMAALTLLTVIQRVYWAWGALRDQ